MHPIRPETILRYLADLAPAEKRISDVAHRAGEFVYLGWRPELIMTFPAASEPRRTSSHRNELRRLAAIDELHSTERLLRLGWLFVAGTVDQERFCFPLLSVPVRLRTYGWEQRLEHDGDIEMPADFFDEAARDSLEDNQDPFGGGVWDPDDRLLARMPRLRQWVETAVAAAALPPATLVPPGEDPLEMRRRDGLSVVAGAAIYTARDVAAPNVRGTLLSWASQELTGTAFDALYGGEPTGGNPAPSDPVMSALPLNVPQRKALQRARVDPITIVSGPPGTGKSHLVAAAAVDEVARGNTVLIATQSDYAARVIADLLERHPGPRFVRFGKRADRENVADELAEGLAQPLPDREFDAVQERSREAATRRDAARGRLAAALEREAAFVAGLRQRAALSIATAQAPGALDPSPDLAKAERLLAAAERSRGLLASWRRSRAHRKLRALLRARPEATAAEVISALEAARAERAVQAGLAGGGLVLAAAWSDLEEREAEWRRAVGRATEAVRRARDNRRRTSTRAVAALASALRAGRVQRRRALAGLSGDHFLDVLPLWLGTLQEIDDTLPVAPGMFDVVIFDEASQIDQLRAAPALARARRAMIVGDPRQLRHVSFIADEAMEQAGHQHGLAGDTRQLLDVRRNSLFDAGAAASHVTWLDEHFRSVPHIISFSNRHFYGERLRLMTQHPRTESLDAIRVLRIDGTRDGDGVNAAEVAAVVAEVKKLGRSDHHSIGVVSPFRAQADALEEALLDELSPDQVSRFGLRVGTVHAFQGNERDVVIASLAMTEDDARASLRFVENPNLFNVLVTRARREMIVVTSLDAAALPRGLLSDYLRHAGYPPLPSESELRATGWAGEIQGELERFGVPVTADYPVAGWTVDLAVGQGSQAVGIECTVHPDGPTAHIERHLALRRAGWKILDAFQSRWLTEPDAAAEWIVEQVLRAGR